MATKKAAKKSAKKPAKTAGKTPAKTPAKKKLPPAKKPPPPKKGPQPPRRRGTPLIVTVDATSLSLSYPPSGSPIAFDTLLFIDQSKMTEAQMALIEDFAEALGLRALSMAVGKAWGEP
jgi:hypothetical protein